MEVLITGGRDFLNLAQMEVDLRGLLPLGLKRIIHGACPHGADALANHLGLVLLGADGVLGVPAAWNIHGNAAGPIRNIEMLDKHKPKIVLGYPTPKSRGTWHCIAEAAARKIPVIAFIPWWKDDISELVRRETLHYKKEATGVRQGTHVVIRAA